MALEQPQKPKEKQGILAYGFEVGDRLPFFPEDIPHRVGRDGALEWASNVDDTLFWLNATEGLRNYSLKKRGRIYDWIFRGFNLFSRALMGFSIRLNWVGYNIDDLLKIFPLEAPIRWEKAPRPVQHMALLGALQYLQPQLHSKGSSR